VYIRRALGELQLWEKMRYEIPKSLQDRSEDESMGARERDHSLKKNELRVKRGTCSAAHSQYVKAFADELVSSLKTHLFNVNRSVYISIAFKQFDESSFYCRTRLHVVPTIQ
jgi:hypothetical protein